MEHQRDKAEHWQRHDGEQGFQTTVRRLKRHAAAKNGCYICKAILAALVVFVPNPKRRAMVRVGASFSGGHVLQYLPKVDYGDLDGSWYEDFVHSGSESEYSLDSEYGRRSSLDEEDEEDEEEEGDDDEEGEEEEGDDDEEGDKREGDDDDAWQAEQKVSLELYVDIASKQPPAWPALKGAYTLGSSFYLDNAHRLREWLAECRRDHGLECDAKYLSAGDGASHTVTIPTRLLDIGVGDPGEDVGADKAIRLYETSPGEQAEYIALSHCWGGKGSRRPPETVAENLASRKKAIPMSELPPTFHDAVRLTRLLGFRYLWIDSLCIIQRDVADWERESARMVYVYLHATLTIAADGAADSDGGLFAPVGRRDEEFCSTEIRLRDLGIPGDGCFCVRRTHGDIAEKNVCQGDPRRDPLASRGWAFQEWLLSPRIAHFGTGELTWQCGVDHYHCECQARGVTYRNMGGLKSQYTPVFQGCLGYHWHALITIFSWRSLTVREDRLPAVSGLVGLVLLSGAVHSHDYIAGHWRSNLLPSLLWRRHPSTKRVDGTPPGGMIERLSGSYAPTWSWGSVDSPIRFDMGTVIPPKERELLTTVVDIKVTEISAQASRLGLVKSAEIRLRGAIGIFPDPVLVAKDGQVYVGKHGYIILDVTRPLEIEDCDLSELIFLAIREEAISKYTLYGLALRLDRERDVFRRVGLATLSCNRPLEKAWKMNELKIRENAEITIV